MKKTITSLMASTMILGQLGGLTALAGEQESIHIEEPLDLTDETAEEADGPSQEEKLNDSSEITKDSLEDGEDKEDDVILFEDEPLENEEDSDTLDAYEPDEFIPNYWDDYDDDPYYDYYGESPFTHIDSVEVNVSSTEIKFGEKILLSTMIEDIPQDSTVGVLLESDSGKHDRVNLTYNNETGLYEGDFDFLNSNFIAKEDREITVETVELMDSDWVHVERFSLYNGGVNAITLHNNIDIPESKPEIKLDTLSVSSNEIFDEERIQLEVEIESDSEIASVKVAFDYLQFEPREVKLTRFKDTNLFVGFFTKFYSNESVDYTFNSINARDIYGNETHFSADDYDFSRLTIEYNLVKQPVMKEAAYVTDSLAVSHSNIKEGDTVTFKAQLDDAEYLHSAFVLLRNVNEDRLKRVDLYYDHETDYFIGEWHIDNETMSGDYLPIQLNGDGAAFLSHSFDEDYAEDFLMTVVVEEKEAPVFEINSITAEESEVDAGTINRLILDIDTDEPVDYYLLGINGYQVNIAAYYNPETGLYEAILHTDISYSNNVVLYSLAASVEDQRVFIDLADIDLTEARFTIIPKESDGEVEREPFNPDIDRDNISQPKSFVKAGETVTVTVPIADYSKIARGSVLYRTPLTNSIVTVDLTYNDDLHVFEAVLPTDESVENGWWRAREISLLDLDYSNYYIGAWDDEDAKLLSGLDFIFSGGLNSGYIEPLTVTSVNTNAESFEAGEDVNIAVSVTNPRFQSLQLTYRMPESRLTRVITAYLNEDTGDYEASFTINGHYESGRWVLEGVETQDYETFNNAPTLFGGNFIVVNENSEVSLPSLNTEEFSASYNADNNILTLSATVSNSEAITGLRVEYRDISTDRILYIELHESDVPDVFESQTRLDDYFSLEHLRLMKIELLGHHHNVLDTIRTTNFNPVTGIDAVFSDIAVASDEEDESDDSDVSPELPEDDTDESESDDELDQDEPESDEDASEDDSSVDQDTDDESDEDNEDETDSEEEAGLDVPADETDEEVNSDDSDVEDNDEEETEHDSEEIVEENDNQGSGNAVEEVTDGSASEETANESDEESDLESGDTGEPANDHLESPSSDDENDTEEEASTEENDSETVDSEITEVEEAVETDAEEETEAVDSSTVLPDTATATWTIGMASFVSLLSGLGLRFVSKKKRKQ